uniref:Uncharacterized protein n=1 Tax=viral metagenome TaxID=1070528 RepID=A0A6C0LRP3_9ZZZZ
MDYITSKSYKNEHSFDSVSDSIIITGKTIEGYYRNLEIYNAELEHNVLNQNLRKSKTYTVHHSDYNIIFEYIDLLVQLIRKTTDYEFNLIPNSVDIIRYEKGDCSGKHYNFSPVKNKYLKYYSLLFCLDSEAEGGEIKLYLPNKVITFDEIITTGEWILFRNDIDYEELILNAGHKLIMKIGVILLDFANTNYKIYENFQNLIDNKVNIINKFVNEGILPTYDISEYVFYRKYFEEDENIIPFQILIMNSDNKRSLFTSIGYFCVGNSNIIWDIEPIKMSKLKDNNLYNIECQKRLLKKFESIKCNDNELERILSLTIFLFWNVAIQIEQSDHLKSTSDDLDKFYDKYNLLSMIEHKIDSNLLKIKNSIGYDNLNTLKKHKYHSDVISKISNKHSKILNSFQQSTLEYKMKASHENNETYTVDLYFGFIKF